MQTAWAVGLWGTGLAQRAPVELRTIPWVLGYELNSSFINQTVSSTTQLLELCTVQPLEKGEKEGGS